MLDKASPQNSCSMLVTKIQTIHITFLLFCIINALPPLQALTRNFFSGQGVICQGKTIYIPNFPSAGNRPLTCTFTFGGMGGGGGARGRGGRKPRRWTRPASELDCQFSQGAVIIHWSYASPLWLQLCTRK